MHVTGHADSGPPRHDLALGVPRALPHSVGAVRGDVGGTGCDVAPHSGFVTPVLTAVRTDLQDLGRAACQLPLTRRESGNRPPDPALFAPELVPRESSGRRNA
ncbi:substrate-binding domain-containing protein [Streptomyces griseorubiginosus]|uniref:substrate-binding domain-containing protein n=1 Tax=Streptomyces griseorubiginosus TaxID=67304 RepID=UPI002E7FFE30|nr:substrate-binding domain-containing protein [Streptomyces griseorubiginosus]WUB49609.1 substrate-binding domain-containing protein [Streptomyces griseorubiginosus]WUB58138.1 substrate-binding domain-containing protein [Streptomyces griseorubiginosus]